MGAPEIGRRALNLCVLHQAPVQAPLQPAAPLPLPREVPLYDDYYRAAPVPRMPNPSGVPGQHCLAKLDTFKGENGERLDDFIYQVEKFAAFHAWDPVETCRQARTHLRGVALVYIRHVHLPPYDWQELKDLLTRRFQPRDLRAAYKGQFKA